MVKGLDLQQVRQALEYECEQLLHGQVSQDSFRQTLENHDENDLADLFEIQEIQTSLDELSKRKLERIVKALDRLKKGTYGICLGCKATIPADRLLALPCAEFCVICQKRLEGEGKGY